MKIEASGASFSACSDRFVTEGYRQGLTPEEQLNELAKIDGLSGIPIMVPLEFDSIQTIQKKLKSIGKEVGTIAPDTYMNPRLKDGSLTSRDPAYRKECVRLFCESMDICAELGGSDILLWLAHDGYDYPFEDDYMVRWNWLLEGLEEIASYRSDVRVTIEYKTKEPRTRQYISDIGKSLFICEKIGRENLGIVVDVGHSLFAGENPAEAIALAAQYNRLFHIHLNDNYRSWDDDLLVGGIHFWETLEAFYLLNKLKYDGWLTIDIWPSRIDGFKALSESVKRIQMFERLANNLPMAEIQKLQAEGKTMDIAQILRHYCIKGE